MNTRLNVFSLLALSLIAFLSSPIAATAQGVDPSLESPTSSKWNVIFLTLDGVREQEFFAKKERLFGRPQVGFPKFWDTLKQDSQHKLEVYEMSISNSYAISLPGYQDIFTGKDQGERCKNNGCPQVDMETFPERLIREGFAKKDVASIASWDGLSRAVESKPGTIYGNFASQKFPDMEMNEIQAAQDADPAPWAPARLDRYTGAHAMAYIKKYHPRFIHIGFDDSDEWGHRREYDHYVNSLHQYDEYIQSLMAMLRDSGEYGKNTALIITTDHGRGSGPFWKDHSKELASAFHTWAILRMPENYQQKFQKSDAAGFEQIDLRPTIETLLGLPPVESLGGRSLFRKRLSTETVEKLNSLRTAARSWAETCSVSARDVNPAFTYQSHGECPLGDMTLFSGLGCLAGEKGRCLDIKMSQDANGRFWRNPDEMGKERNNSFSRDQGLGVLAYLIATRDVEAAKKWEHWIKTEGNGVKMCASSDGMCDLHPGFANLMGDIWKYLGLTPLPIMTAAQAVPPITKELEILMLPKGYRIHLAAVEVWLRQALDHAKGSGDFAGSHFLAKSISKRERHNPFMLYLKDGVTEEVARLTLEQCPRTRPAAQGTDWAWQRTESDHAWERSSGHDCIFMANLLLGSEQP